MSSNAFVIKTKTQSNEFHESVGKTLNFVRVKQKYTLDDVSKATKIRTYFLNSLEENDFNALPGAVFTTGFIRSYCEFLNISSEPLISYYISQSSKNEIDPPFKLHIPQSSEKFITSRIVIISFFIIVSSSIIWHFIQNNDLVKIMEINDLNKLDPIEVKTVKTKFAKIEPEEHQEVTQIKNNNLESNESIEPQIKQPTNDTTSILTESLSPSDTTPTLEKTDFNIEAIEETWLKITNEQGERLKVSYLKKGEVFSLKSYEGNLISVGNAENVDFVMGDKRIKGSEYLEIANGFVGPKKIIASKTPNVIGSLTSDPSSTTPVS